MVVVAEVLDIGDIFLKIWMSWVQHRFPGVACLDIRMMFIKINAKSTLNGDKFFNDSGGDFLDDQPILLTTFY